MVIFVYFCNGKYTGNICARKKINNACTQEMRVTARFRARKVAAAPSTRSPWGGGGREGGSKHNPDSRPVAPNPGGR